MFSTVRRRMVCAAFCLLAVSVRADSQPGALRGAFNDYRTGEEDVAQD